MATLRFYDDGLPESIVTDRILRLESAGWWRAAEYETRSYMYAVQAVTGGPIKLGRTVDPSSRLKGLSTASAVPLRFLITVPEWVVSEADAHEKWQHLRCQGEWFEPDQPLLDWLQIDLPLLQAQRTVIAERYRQVAKRREARLHEVARRQSPFRRFAYLIKRVEIEREREERRLAREVEKASVAAARAARLEQPCPLCGAFMTNGSTAPLENFFTCKPCARWVRACVTDGRETVEQTYLAAIAKAEETLARAQDRLSRHVSHCTRMDALSLDAVATSHGWKVGNA
jgi:hypothetical protein